MRKLGAALIFGVIATLAVAPVSAASQAPPAYVGSEPGRGEKVHEAPDQVSISFDQPLDPDSFIEVEDHCGRRVDDRNTTVSGTEMEVALTKGPAGMYHVTYFAKGIAGVTGQSTGIFTFTAHAGPSCGKGGGHHHGGDNGSTGKHSGHNGKHSGHERNGHEGGGHGTGSEHSGTTHSAVGHAGMTHSPTGHGGHVGTAGGGDHGGGHDSGGHAGHREPDPKFPNTLAGGRGPSLRVDSTAVYLSLGLSALLGLLGGWILRISATRPTA